MTVLRKVVQDSETENADGNKAQRVVLTSPDSGDSPGPTNLLLNGQTAVTIAESQASGTEIGTLSVDSGIAPLSFTIIQDLGNAFQIDGNKLETSRIIIGNVDPMLNVSIRCTDGNGKITDRTFVITVIANGGFVNKQSYDLSDDAYAIVPSTNYLLNAPATWWAWVKIDMFTGISRIIYDSRNAIDLSGVVIAITGNASVAVVATTPDGNEKRRDYTIAELSQNKWALLGVTILNNEIKLYYNGELQIPTGNTPNQNIQDIDSTSTQAYIGRRFEATGGGDFAYYGFFIDEIGYSTKVGGLTDAQWVAIYNNGVSANLQEVLGDDLDHWYRADGDNLQTLTDNKGSLDALGTRVQKANISAIAYTKNIATRFDSTSYYLGSGLPDFSLAKSFSFWIKRDSTASEEIIYSDAQSVTDDNSFSIYFDSNASNRLFVRVNGVGESQQVSWDIGNINQYVHVVLTFDADFNSFDASGYSLYVNSTLSTPTIVSDTLTTAPPLQATFSIGASTVSSSNFVGDIAQMTIWDTDLNQTQVLAIYNLGSPVDPFSLDYFRFLASHYDMGETNIQAAMYDRQTNNLITLINFDEDSYVSYP